MYLKKSVIGAIGLILLASCSQKPQASKKQKSSKKYPVTTLVKQDAVLHTVFPTVLKGQVDIEIKPRVDGFIEEVYVDEGSVVKKGQALFKINSPSSIQELETAQSSYNTAQLDVERMRPLAKKGIISEVLLKSYVNTFNSAQANLNKAKSAMSWTMVTSPINGTAGELSYRIGSLVTNTSVLTSIANTEKVVAYFSMNEKELLDYLRKWEGNTQAEKIKNMPSLQLILADGSTYEETGKIETISGLVDQNTGSVNFRAIFDNPQSLLRSGTSGKIVIPQTLKNVMVIPQKATFNLQDKVLVYLLDGNKVNQKTIAVKPTPDGKSYAVLKGLKEGDKIVTDGVATLKNGMEIQIQ